MPEHSEQRLSHALLSRPGPSPPPRTHCRDPSVPPAPGSSRELQPLTSSPGSTASGPFSVDYHFFPGLTGLLYNRHRLCVTAAPDLAWSTVQPGPAGLLFWLLLIAQTPILGVQPPPSWAQSLETGFAAPACNWALLTFSFFLTTIFKILIPYSLSATADGRGWPAETSFISAKHGLTTDLNAGPGAPQTVLLPLLR